MHKMPARLAFISQSDAWRVRWLPYVLTVLCYGVLVSGISSPVGRGLLLAQYGVFLLWQPLIKPGFTLTVGAALCFFGGGVVFALLANGWLFALWLSILCALLSSMLLADRLVRLKLLHLGLLAHLLFLLLWVVPQLGDSPSRPYEFEVGLRYAMPVTLGALALIPVERARSTARGAGNDFFYALFTWLVLLVCVLGSLALRQLYDFSYPEALTITLLTLGGGLATLAWLWSPRAGFAGIGALINVHLLQLGSPFERWSAILAALAAKDSSPEVFMADAAAALTALPTVTGGLWFAPAPGGSFGTVASHEIKLSAGEVRLLLYSTNRASPVLIVQYQLVAELLNQFYLSKQREVRLRRQAYIEAVHEAGARLTHDIKNLLQSLQALVEVSSSHADPVRTNALFARQLPEIARRLEATLSRLQKPESVAEARCLAAGVWWEELCTRYTNLGIDFNATGEDAALIVDASLFDNVIDNLLGNAIEKRDTTPGLHISVHFNAHENWQLSVRDNGAAVPEILAARLLREPVPSASGFGLGLYHAAKLAAQRGAQLILAENHSGCVQFDLLKVSNNSGTEKL